MITFKAIIIPNNRRKDGTYPVKIRVTFRGKTRRLPTNLVCRQEDITRNSGRIKSAFIINKADEIISRMRKAAADIPLFDLEGKDVDWIVARIKAGLAAGTFRLDFFSFADEEFLPKTAGSARRGYVTALNAFERFHGRRSCDINDITKAMLQEFVEFRTNEKPKHYDKERGWIDCRTEKKNGVSTYMNVKRLATIFKAAKAKYNDEDEGKVLIPRSPFDKVTVEKPEPCGQGNLGVAFIQRLIDDRTATRLQRQAIDTFLLSFCLMGANMADMYAAKAPKGDDWTYYRQKTRGRRRDKAKMVVRITAPARMYMSRVASRNGWMLGAMHDKLLADDYATPCVNRRLASWCKANGVEPFTFYAARHTWASLARQQGVGKGVIDECLAHVGDYDLVDIYAPERNWEQMAEANARVLALFTWPEE